MKVLTSPWTPCSSVLLMSGAHLLNCLQGNPLKREHFSCPRQPNIHALTNILSFRYRTGRTGRLVHDACKLNKYKWQKRNGMWEKPKREPFKERRREQKKSISTKLKKRLENKPSALTQQKSSLFPLWLTCWFNGSTTKNIENFKNLSLDKSKKKIQPVERVPIWDLVCSFTAEGCNDTTN